MPQTHDEVQRDASVAPKDGPVKIPVVEGHPLHSGVKTVSGSIPIDALLRRYRIPYRDSLRKIGYQRRPQHARISRFASDLKRSRVDVPTSILLNLRKEHADGCTQREGEQLFLVLDEQKMLYVVDGQHRVLAFERLCEEDLEKWRDTKLQFVLMLGASEQEEVKQFYTVNTTAKSVRTDLALDLLKQRVDQDGRVLEEVTERGQKWRVEAQAIVDELSRQSQIWRGRIRLANADKADSVIPAASFVVSLRPLLVGSPFFGTLSLDQQVRLLDAHWKGIREAMRDPFDGNPNDYALQKGIGVAAMHDILVAVIEHVRSTGESVFDATAFQKIMTVVLSELEGENTDGEPVSGADFWLSASLGGAAGTYSSSAGKRVLFAKLRSALPEQEVE